MTAFLASHWTAIALGFGLVASPAVATMPNKIPASAQDWWTWFYDYAHQLTNSRNTRLATEPIPTPPVASLGIGGTNIPK